MTELGFLMIVALAVAFDLTNLIQGITQSAMNAVEALIFLAFVIGLGAYVIPYLENIQAHGKALMVRAAIGQVLFSLSTIIFAFLSTFGA